MENETQFIVTAEKDGYFSKLLEEISLGIKKESKTELEFAQQIMELGANLINRGLCSFYLETDEETMNRAFALTVRSTQQMIAQNLHRLKPMKEFQNAPSPRNKKAYS